MLIADRFISLNGRTIDLACGRPVVFRRLPAADRGEQLAWTERCTTLSHPANGSAPLLVDYGLLNDGARFEAGRMANGREVREQLYADSAARREDRRGECHADDIPNDRFESFVQQAADLFETGCFGEPRVLRLSLVGGLLPPALLDTLARHARLHGFIPVSVELLANAERRPSDLGPPLREIVETRHLLLITGAPVTCTRRGWCARRTGRIAVCPVAVARLVLATAVKSARPNVLLLVTDCRAGAPAAMPACLVEDEAGRRGRGAGVEVGYPVGASAARFDLAAEAHEGYQLTRAPDVVRLRARAADAIRDARAGRALRAEHNLREVLGGLARRDDAAGAAWVALNLGGLLLDRGRALDAARIFEAARAHFDRAADLQGAARAIVYLGLAWTDEGRLTEAEAACRTALIAAQEAGLNDLAIEANLGLARCLYWQARFDEATVVAASVVDGLEPAPGNATTPLLADRAYPCEAGERPVALVRETRAIESWGSEPRPGPAFRRSLAMSDSDRRVRVMALAARLAVARGDLRAATVHAAGALDAAACGAPALEACIAHTAVACVRGALNDIDGLLDHVRGGLEAARRAHAPLRALRLRLLACDNLRLAGRQAEASRLLRRLATLDPARFPGLLRARLQIVVSGDGHGMRDGPAGPSALSALVAASCPWRPATAPVDMAEQVAGVLQVCHEAEDEEAALGRVCEAVRERMRAVAISVVGRDDGAAAVLARSGPAGGRCTVAERVLDTGLPVAAVTTPLGLEAASPIRYAGAVIGAVGCRWPAGALVDTGRTSCLLSAAAAATAPHVRTLLDRRESQPAAPDRGGTQLVGVSPAIEALRKAALRAAGAPFPVLVEGESGSGKELVARAIHHDSPRRARRFCALNCAALTDDLLEAELFGHVRGAFTGAISERVGLFEEADGGTLFLDEVADLSPRAQAKLLRVLQDGEVRRIGENFARHVDARVIAATNRRLDAEVASGTFRRDLFYRLNVVHIDVPPLRDRPEDVPVLAGHFWQRSIARIGGRATLSPATLAALARYDWPGNVRELQNVMAALAVSAPRRGSVGPACLPAVVARAETGRATLEEARRVFERRFVQAALARAGGHRGRAAAAMGISRQGLAKLIVRLGLGSGNSTV